MNEDKMLYVYNIHDGTTFEIKQHDIDSIRKHECYMVFDSPTTRRQYELIENMRETLYELEGQVKFIDKDEVYKNVHG